MSHEIAFDKARNQHMVFTAGAPAWHALGQNVAEAVAWQEAMRLAGLNWEVVKDTLYDRDGKIVPAWGIFRLDTGQYLGVVGAQYVPIQNQFAFDFVDTLVGTGGAHYESAGALYHGQTIWCLARLPKADGEIVPGDTQQAFLLFTPSHDGSHSAVCKLVNL